MADKLLVNISTLKTWDKNPRNISKDGLERLKKQITKLGQYKPLLIKEDGTILGGNMRYRAYKELGITDVWVSVVNPKDKNEELEYALSDNDRAGYYDDDLLANLTSDYEIDWDDYAVDLKEPTILGDLLDQFKEVEEDEAPELDEQAEPVSKLGEVYQLGRHRLMCGDSANITDLSDLMSGNKAQMVFTDPPYGYSYQSNFQDKHEMLMNDDVIIDFLPIVHAFTENDTPYYIFCGWQTVKQWVEKVEQSDLKLKNIIIWKKNNWSMGDLQGAYAGQYEIMLFAHKGRVLLVGGRDRDIWEFDREPPTGHPTMKPVGLVARAISNHNAESVLDLFGGSGTTLIACEQTNRTCYMMELDPKYCDVIRKRYANYIGKGDDWEITTPIITGT